MCQFKVMCVDVDAGGDYGVGGNGGDDSVVIFRILAASLT